MNKILAVKNQKKCSLNQKEVNLSENPNLLPKKPLLRKAKKNSRYKMKNNNKKKKNNLPILRIYQIIWRIYSDLLSNNNNQIKTKNKMDIYHKNRKNSNCLMWIFQKLVRNHPLCQTGIEIEIVIRLKKEHLDFFAAVSLICSKAKAKEKKF